MIISICKRLTLAALLILSSINHTYPNTSDQTPPAAEEQPAQQASAQDTELQEHFQKILTRRLDEFKTIDRVLQDLLLLIDNSASINSIKKSELRESAIAMRDLIKNINDEVFAQIDPGTLQLLSHISKELTKHVIHALNNHLTTLPPFDIEQAMTRLAPIDVTLEDLYADFEISGKLLQKLEEKAGSAGLRWYNKAYRKFDKWVIQPSEKYSVGSRLKKLAVAAALGTWLWWHTDSHNPTLRNWLGYSPRLGAGNSINQEWHAGNNADQAPRPLGWLGNLEGLFIEGRLGYIPVGAYLAYMLYNDTMSEVASGSSFLSRKVHKLHNFLKGGAYYQNFEKPDEKFSVNPRITFKDIIGMENAKDKLSFIVKYMENPEQYDRSRNGSDKGFLLTGPAGSGKTYIVEGLAGEIKEMYKRKGKRPEDFNFFVLNATFIQQEGIKNLIDRAKALAPCILFIDEIDLLGLQRVSGNTAMLSEFLTSMSGALEQDPDKAVFIIAATNKPENIDHALLRDGRLGTEIHFEYPTFNERVEYLTRRLSKLANINNFDVHKLAQETEGKTFEALSSLIRNAFQRGVLRNQALTQDLLMQGLDEAVYKIIPSTNWMAPEEKKLVAAYQAGRALATVLLGHEQLAKVTIKPYLSNVKEEFAFDQFIKHDLQQQKKHKYGKIYTFHTYETKNINTLEQKLALCKQALAGFAAEKIVLGSSGYSNHPEFGQQALDVATSVVTEGVDIYNPHFPQELRAKYVEKALELKKKCEHDVTKLLEQHKDALNKIVQALMEKETLTGQEVMQIAGIVKAA